MEYQKQFIQQQRTKQDINAAKPQEKVNLPPAIYPEIRNLQNQINQEGPQVPNQVNETAHQRQPPPSNANTTEQPPVQAEGNNEQRETEKREPVSGNQVSESGKTGPLTTPQGPCWVFTEWAQSFESGNMGVREPLFCFRKSQ
ncbi:Hypothetical_protein [Hexamita inflata]|uniref:Hypothetical_protein n=1 Tax=Hexamita inflata TaxID=28002 RepID=A0AA86UIM4_9EUKA|nr:Hypothetical protein HINF_LOCUS40320 [Hexamita inflata]CAI9952677.1 Hypothetical protein HINF_LOCUS40322 [Hexamita inflata]